MWLCHQLPHRGDLILWTFPACQMSSPTNHQNILGTPGLSIHVTPWLAPALNLEPMAQPPDHPSPPPWLGSDLTRKESCLPRASLGPSPRSLTGAPTEVSLSVSPGAGAGEAQGRTAGGGSPGGRQGRFPVLSTRKGTCVHMCPEPPLALALAPGGPSWPRSHQMLGGRHHSLQQPSSGQSWGGGIPRPVCRLRDVPGLPLRCRGADAAALSPPQS